MTDERATEILRMKYPNGSIKSAGNLRYIVSTDGVSTCIKRASSQIELLRQYGFNVINKHTQQRYIEGIKKFERDLEKGTFVDEWGDWGEIGKEVPLDAGMRNEREEAIRKWRDTLENNICELDLKID